LNLRLSWQIFTGFNSFFNCLPLAMNKIKFKIQGVLEKNSSSKILLKPEEKFKVKRAIEEESNDSDEITFKEAEIQPLSKEKDQLDLLLVGATTLPFSP
jgi:hypothetical protein